MNQVEKSIENVAETGLLWVFRVMEFRACLGLATFAVIAWGPRKAKSRSPSLLRAGFLDTCV